MDNIFIILLLLTSMSLGDDQQISSNLTCPPGFISSDGNQCICVDNSYIGLIKCEDDGNTATVLRGGWIGNYSGQIVAGVSSYLYFISDDSNIPLPSNWSDVNIVLCGPLNRHGVLCGECIAHYGPAVESFECVSCTNEDSRVNWLIYVALEYIPLTIFFIFLLLFDVKTTSGAGNAFIFFAQITTSTFDVTSDGVLPLDTITSNNTKILKLLYQLPYDVWNLKFFSILFPPYCLSSNIGWYGLTALNYIIAFYPLFLIIMFSVIVRLYDYGFYPISLLCRPLHRCLIWMRRKWEFRQSVITAFATFLILSYTKFMLTSLKIITPTSLYDASSSAVVSWLPYFNGNTHFTTPGMIGLYIIALTVLFIFGIILPSVLMAPSILQWLYKKTKKDCFSNCLPWGRMQEFLQQFHGCYKDGLNNHFDCRWFSGFFLLSRVIFFCLYSYSPNEFYQYLFQAITCLLTMFLIASLRPFKKNSDNVLNTGIFCLLGISNTLMFCNYILSLHGNISLALFVFQYLLSLFPLLVLIAYFVYQIWKRICFSFDIHLKQRHTLQRKSMSTKDMTKMKKDKGQEELIDERGDLLDFLDFTEATGRLKRSSREAICFVSNDSKRSFLMSNDSINDSDESSQYKYGSILAPNN